MDPVVSEMLAREVPPLPYAYNALEPYIDEHTMHVHHDKHHAAYLNNLMTALEKHPELLESQPEDLLRNLNTVPADIRTAVRNHGGGHVHHAMFWTLIVPKVAVVLFTAELRVCGTPEVHDHFVLRTGIGYSIDHLLHWRPPAR